MIKILIVDDHALVRRGIKRLLEDLPDVVVVGEAESGEQALQEVKLLEPEVILLDIKMPGIGGWEVIRRLNKSTPKVKIIALTSVVTDLFPAKIFKLGVLGYLTKESGVEEMAQAIRIVSKGEKYLSMQIAQKMAMNSLNSNNSSPFEKISEREMQVTIMISSGMSVQEISNKLFLSSKTVNCYRYRIFEKLNIKNDVELTYLAVKHKIIEWPNVEPV